MKSRFDYDVFLGNSPEDEQVADELAARLTREGLRVWSDEDVFDDYEEELNHGSEASRVFVLLMSPAAFSQDWAWLEQALAQFHDADSGRRIVPLLIEDCEVPESVQRYRYIDWRTRSVENYRQLAEACQMQPETPSKRDKNLNIAVFGYEIIGHTEPVWSARLSTDGKTIISASADQTIKLQDLKTGEWHGTLRGHSNAVSFVVSLSEGTQALSASADGTLRLWDIETEECTRIFRGHGSSISTAALTPDESHVLTASNNGVLNLWELASGECVKVFGGRLDNVYTFAITPDGKCALADSEGGVLYLWSLQSGRRLAAFRGHTDEVNDIAITPDGSRALSASGDATLKVWDIAAGKCIATFEGHQESVHRVVIAPDGQLAASASADGTIKLWHIETGMCLQTIGGEEDAPSAGNFKQFSSLAFERKGAILLAGTSHGSVYVYRLRPLREEERVALAPEVRYTNAKVVLLGESGVGKSGLGHRLAEDRWVMTESTHGMRVWSLKLQVAQEHPDLNKEVWLWDLAGQPDYRLVHQLFLDETSLALVLFNPQSNDPFEGLGDWEQALRMATRRDSVKLLVAARTDVGGATLTRDKIDHFCRDHNFAGYFATSAKLDGDAGCTELRLALARHIPWDELPWTSTTKLFKSLKDAVLRLKANGVVLVRLSELRQQLQLAVPDQHFKEEDLSAVVGLLAGQGIVKRLDFGEFVLLQPEQLNNYATAVIRAAREHVDGIGCISESEVLEGRFNFKGMSRLREADEQILLRAMVQSFLDQSLCIREDTPSGVQLAFPSQFNREIKIQTHPNVLVTYRFSGHLSTIYTTLVVRLNYSDTFDRKDLWKDAAEFLTPEGKIVGLVMKPVAEGVGEIKVFLDPGVPEDTRVTFVKYVHEHLLKRANDVERRREYACPKCSKPVNNFDAINARLNAGKSDVVCVYCEARVPLNDLLEQKFNQDRFLKRVRRLDEEAAINLDNESRELMLVGQAMTIAGEAGQIFRPLSNSDHGIDGEIEFKDEQGCATGSRAYLQLKSGDSYLRKRGADGQEVFTVKKPRHLTYWQSQAYPVYLVIRTSDSVIRWMNVTQHLRERQDKTSRQIVFEGEPFNSHALLELRDEILRTELDASAPVCL